jgi:hypothetical protein
MNQDYSQSRETLLRPQATSFANNTEQQLQAVQSFSVVDRILYFGIAIILVAAAASFLVTWPKQQTVVGLVRLSGALAYVNVRQSDSENSILEVKVVEGQHVQRGETIAVAASVDHEQTSQFSKNQIHTQSPIKGIIKKIEVFDDSHHNKSAFIAVQPDDEGYEAQFHVPLEMANQLDLYKKIKVVALDAVGQKEYVGEISRYWISEPGAISKSSLGTDLSVVVRLDSQRRGFDDSARLTEGLRVSAIVSEQNVPLITMLAPSLSR